MSRPDRPTIGDVIESHLALKAQDTHHTLLGKVQSYDPVRRTVDVIPVVKHAVEQPDGSSVYEDLPVLPCVPVAFPRAGGFMVAFSIAPGDIVVVHTFDAASEHWLAGDGAVQYPGLLGRNDLGSCVAYPVDCYPRARALVHARTDGQSATVLDAHGHVIPRTPAAPPGIVVGTDDPTGPRLTLAGEPGAYTASLACNGATIRVTTDGDVVVEPAAGRKVLLGDAAATEFVALATQVNNRLATIQAAFDGHSHAVATSGGPTSQTGTAAPTTSPIGSLASVAATKAKAT